MDLKNKIAHKINTSVSVNGTTYRIDSEGVLRDVPKEDAAKLLLGHSEWKVYTERRPVAAPVHAPPVPAPTPPEDPIAAPTPEADGVEAGDGVAGTDSEAREWPNPSEDLGIDFLRKMAKAHNVKFGNRTKAGTLVERLEKVMFEA